MSDREGFEAAIRENPTDYNRRLVFADWLDEHDEPEEAIRQRKYQSAWESIGDLADMVNMGRRFLLEAAQSHLANREDKWGNYTRMGENEAYKDATEEDWKAFWVNYEIVTGEKVPMEHRDGPLFSCSC